MAKITSNTLVKWSTPFIGLSLKRVLPYIDQMVITISKKADEATKNEIDKISKNSKVEVYWEDVSKIGQLTDVQNEQLKVSMGDWIWLVEDDDLWPEEDLENCLKELTEEKDGITINPFQLTDYEHYDFNKRKKFYPKFFKKEGAYFDRPFPRNCIFNQRGMISDKAGMKVKRVPYHYFHLPMLKDYSFRNNEQYSSYAYTNIDPKPLPEEYKLKLKNILKELWGN